MSSVLELLFYFFFFHFLWFWAWHRFNFIWPDRLKGFHYSDLKSETRYLFNIDEWSGTELQLFRIERYSKSHVVMTIYVIRRSPTEIADNGLNLDRYSRLKFKWNVFIYSPVFPDSFPGTKREKNKIEIVEEQGKKWFHSFVFNLLLLLLFIEVFFVDDCYSPDTSANNQY